MVNAQAEYFEVQERLHLVYWINKMYISTIMALWCFIISVWMNMFARSLKVQLEYFLLSLYIKINDIDHWDLKCPKYKKLNKKKICK